MKKLTKINAETEFQHSCRFKSHRKNATICGKLRGMLMGFSFVAPDCRSILNSNEVKERLVAIGRAIFSYNPDKTDDLRLTNLVDMPESRKAAKNVAKVLKRIINN